MAILVYTENWDGKFKKLSYELVSYAHEIAKQAGTEVHVLSIGNVDENNLKSLGNYGATKILSVNDDALKNLDSKAYSTVIAEAAEKSAADIMIFAHNNTGKSIAPRVAVKMKAGYVPAVTALPEKLDDFSVKKGVFTGKAFANVKVAAGKKVLTLMQNSFELIETDNNADVEVFNHTADLSNIATKVVDVNKVSGKILLNDAEIVVSGGRGMKSPDNWGKLEEFAQLLGAATACSRPVSDEGWRPHSEHTGQTGKIIAPNLYFALGISGAVQHMAGVSGSKVIVAVNTDHEAPVFEVADYGIVGDVHKILPQWIEAVKEL